MNILQLPTELLDEIIYRIASAVGYARISQSCRVFKALVAAKDSLWKPIAQNSTGFIITPELIQQIRDNQTTWQQSTTRVSTFVATVLTSAKHTNSILPTLMNLQCSCIKLLAACLVTTSSPPSTLSALTLPTQVLPWKLSPQQTPSLQSDSLIRAYNFVKCITLTRPTSGR